MKWRNAPGSHVRPRAAASISAHGRRRRAPRFSKGSRRRSAPPEALAQLATAGPVALLLHELADLALLPVARRPGKKLVGVGSMQSGDQAPADQNLVEPDLTRRRHIDQEQDDIREDEDAQVRVEQAQALHLAPCPLF